MPKHNFRNILAWQKGRKLVISVYTLTAKFPQSEMYSLTSQLRRAVVSITSNIAEGSGRGTDAVFSRFLDIAMGSAKEVESQLINAQDLGFISKVDVENINEDIVDVQNLIFGFQKSLNKNKSNNIKSLFFFLFSLTS
jgi:four helix bundle protein